MILILNNHSQHSHPTQNNSALVETTINQFYNKNQNKFLTVFTKILKINKNRLNKSKKITNKT